MFICPFVNKSKRIGLIYLFFYLELFLTPWIQRFFIQQLSVISVVAHLNLSFGFFCPSKTFQEVGVQSANISVERLRMQHYQEMSD